MKKSRLKNWFQSHNTGIIKLNMKFSKLDLLTLLISLFLFSSCKDSSTIGLNLDDSNKITGTLNDTVTVTLNTVLDEPTSTSGLARYPLGYMKDATFGTTEASIAMAVNLPSGAFTLGAAPTSIDSAILVLPFDTSAASSVAGAQYRAKPFYGDSTAVYTITVSQLNTSIKTYSSYLSSQVYPSGDVLGTFTGSIKPTTHVKIISIIDAAPDTALVTVPELRIKLNTAMIQSKILALDSLLLTTDYKFNAAFRGLKITASTTGTNGGIMFLNFASANSNLEIYYKHQNATTTTKIDTVAAKFPIITTTNPVAATITHNYTGTPIAAQLAAPGVYQTTYLQAMSGIRNKITFPSLATLKAKIGSNIIINKAELVIDSSDPADSIPFKIAPRLLLYKLDIAGQRANVPDNNAYSSSANTGGDLRPATSGVPFGGYYNFTKKSYAFSVTNYVQDIIDGKLIDYGTYLAPIAYDALPSYPNPYPLANNASRVVIGSFNNTSNRKIRLNIYYVKTTNK